MSRARGPGVVAGGHRGVPTRTEGEIERVDMGQRVS